MAILDIGGGHCTLIEINVRERFCDNMRGQQRQR
jgi:hypothetical protein